MHSHTSEILYYIFTVSYVGEVGDLSGQGKAKWREEETKSEMQGKNKPI